MKSCEGCAGNSITVHKGRAYCFFCGRDRTSEFDMEPEGDDIQYIFNSGSTVIPLSEHYLVSFVHNGEDWVPVHTLQSQRELRQLRRKRFIRRLAVFLFFAAIVCVALGYVVAQMTP